MNKRVEVIAHYLEDGTIRPLKIRLSDENEVEQVYKVKIIDRALDKKMHIVKFKISININGVNKVCKLLFYAQTYEWYLDI